MVHDLARRRVADADRQIPSLFHALGLDAGDRPDFMPPRRHLRAAELARASACADPCACSARFARLGLDVDVAAKRYGGFSVTA